MTTPCKNQITLRLTFMTACVALSIICLSQDKKPLEIERWIKKQGIKLNAPQAPAGFSFFYHCQLRPAYRRDSGDTITLYTWAGSIAEDLKTFKKTARSQDFNIFRYPSKTQGNETVVVTSLGRRDFVWRNDTLYILDSFNAGRNAQEMKLMDKYLAGTVKDDEYKVRTKELEGQDFGFKPKYKAIYFSGIFNVDHSYTFPAGENFRQETVHWKGASFMQGKKYFEINLVTNADGRYRFSEDMSVLETANCFQ